MSWLGPVLLAWLLLSLPGFALLLASGVRLPVRWGWAPVVTVPTMVALAAVLHLLGLPWSPVPVAAGLLVTVVLTAAVRAVLARRRAACEPDPAGEADPAGEDGGPVARLAGVDGEGAPRALHRSALLSGSAILLGLLVVGRASRHMGGIGTLNGSYDSFFHLSAIAFIRRDGDAFLTTALRGIYGESTFYPVAFDSLAALLPFDTITSANALMLACLASLPAAVAALASTVVTEPRRLPWLALAAAATSTLFLSTAAMGLVMGLWPIVLGTVCLPPALAAVLLVMRRHGLARLRALALAAGATLGAALAHPSVFFSVAVAAGLAVVVHGALDLGAGHRRRGLVLIGLAVGGLGAYMVGAATVLGGMSITPPAGVGRLDLLGLILSDTPRIPAVVNPGVLFVVPWLLGLLGAVVAVRHREAVGITAAAGTLAAVILGEITDNPWAIFAPLVNPWYGARERIAPLMAFLLLVLMARGLAALVAWAARAPDREAALAPEVSGTAAPDPATPVPARTRLRLASPLIAGALVAASVVAGLALPGRYPLLGSLAYTAYGLQLSPYVTELERDFIEETAADLPADAVVLGDPRDGTTLYWSLGGVETVYPTMASPLTRDTRLIGRYLTVPDDRRLVCGALHRVEPTYLYRDTSQYAGWRLSPEASSPWVGVRGVPAHLLTPVAQEGPYALYELELPC